MYSIDTYYTYNVFGADEHYNVRLSRLKKNGKYETINVWSYSTFMKERLAHSLAERKIRKLKATYDATVD
jgi:hypothetical protein